MSMLDQSQHGSVKALELVVILLQTTRRDAKREGDDEDHKEEKP